MPYSNPILFLQQPLSEQLRYPSCRTPVQQPVQDLAMSGSPGRSMAVTWNVGAGQNLPPRPSTTHSCTQIASSCTCSERRSSLS